MSKKLLSFLLKELTTVRVICKGKFGQGDCQGIVEVPLEKIDHLGDCPFCHRPFQDSADTVPRLKNLATAIRNMNEPAVTGRYVLEFVLEKEPKSPVQP
jgi:hypothetical protein